MTYDEEKQIRRLMLDLKQTQGLKMFEVYYLRDVKLLLEEIKTLRESLAEMSAAYETLFYKEKL